LRYLEYSIILAREPRVAPIGFVGLKRFMATIPTVVAVPMPLAISLIVSTSVFLWRKITT